MRAAWCTMINTLLCFFVMTCDWSVIGEDAAEKNVQLFEYKLESGNADTQSPKAQTIAFLEKKGAEDGKSQVWSINLSKEDEEYGVPDKGPDPLAFATASQVAIRSPEELFLLKEQRAPPQEVLNEKEKFFRERELVYRARQRRVQRVCQEAGEAASYGSVVSAPLHRLRWLTSHGLIICFNAKVGTSTWTQYLMEVARPGFLKNISHWHYTAEKVLKPPDSRYSENSLAMMEKFGKVILVRHPFARIVSAYLDKVASGTLKRLCIHIIKRYRPTSSPDISRIPTFKEFVQFLVDVTTPEDDVRKKKATRSDRHWFHYYANCATCDIHYDVIGTAESVHEDTRYIIEKFKLGLSDTVWNNHRSKGSSEDTALRLFKDLPRNLTLALHQRYRLDFLMFGYNITSFLVPP